MIKIALKNMKIVSLLQRNNIIKRLCSSNKTQKKFGDRYLTNAEETFDYNAWDNVEWTEDINQDILQKIDNNSLNKIPIEKRIDYEKNSVKYWNDFYTLNQDKFFKDRKWIFTEFPELAPNYDAPQRIHPNHSEELKIFNTDPLQIFEIGCGVGNTVIPILQHNFNPQLRIYCSDFSENAINILKSRSEFDNKRCSAFILDATNETWSVPFEENSLDLIILIFVLRTISPEKVPCILQKCFQYLKPGGQVLFRDRGRHDLAQVRIKPGQCITDNFYVCGNGTRAYFFTEEEVGGLFENAGFSVSRLWTDKRLQINRKRKLKMYRVWIVGRFIKLENKI